MSTLPRLPKGLFIPALCFAAIIGFQSVGWFMAWQGLQFMAHGSAQQMMEQGIDKLPQKTLHRGLFQEKGREKGEIRLDGQLFDYRIVVEKGDSVRVALYHDRPEEALYSLLGHIFKAETDANKPLTQPMAIWLAQWLGASFLLPEKPAILVDLEQQFQKQGFDSRSFATQFEPHVYTQPPEQVV